MGNSIVIDTPRIDKHKKTTDEIRACIKDIKVLGMKELRSLKKWKDALKKEFDEIDEANKDVEEAVPAIHVKTKEEIEDEELAEVDKQIDELKDEERRAARRKKKKELKEKQKRIEKINLKMIIPGDEGPTATEEGLFRMSDLKNNDDLEKVVNDGKLDLVAEDSDEEEDILRPKHEKYDKEKGVLDSNGLWYNEQIEEGKESDDESDESDDGEELGLEWEENESDEEGDENVEKQDEQSSNPLITSLTDDDIGDRKARKAEMWFQKIGEIEDDSDLEEAEMKRAVDIVEKKGGSIKKKAEQEVQSGAGSGYQSDTDEEDQVGNIHHQNMEDTDDSDSEEEEEVEHKSASGKVYNKDGFEVVPKQKIKKRKPLSYEELALGEQLIKSKKAKRDIMDNGWNRFMFNDENLPDWFQKEEELHMKKNVEAKARRKRRVAKKLEMARKKSANILENEDIGSREKAAEINKLYKKAAQAGKSKEVSYVVAKEHKAQKRSQRPAGIKGPYKQVDARMKKDNDLKRGNAKQGKKRRLKEKQAKPTKQFNTNKSKGRR